jgi:tRNA1Val (adenine37-N6)-methyltransferase
MDTRANNSRAMFPRGLAQSHPGSRFSLDPLLLASFATVKKDDRLLDLGTGCGVAALAALLAHETEIRAALGLDIDPELILAAGRNARLVGLADKFSGQCADIRNIETAVGAESFSLVLANPPYRAVGSGQDCPDPARARARSELQGTLEDFLRAGAWGLSNRGRLGLVYPAPRLAQVMDNCLKNRLQPKRLRLVHSRLDEPARLMLLEAVKNGGPGLSPEPPLILYQAGSSELTPEALAFCAFLRPNQGRPEPGV